MVIGTFAGGTHGSDPLVITLNFDADATAVQALMRNITYENVSPDPDTTPRTVRFVLTDGDGGTSNSAAKTINITTAPWGINGFVYEDVDGDGDILDDGVAVANVFVHLYRDGGDGTPDGVDDVYLPTEVTDFGGEYAFGDRADGTYWVVVDSTSIAPTAGYNGGFDVGDVWAEQTYGSAGSVTQSGAFYAYSLVDGSVYGGKRGEVSDDASALVAAEHVNRVVVSGANVSDVDFGFSFNTVTRTGDGDDDLANNRTVQGSLRQFIQNSNAIAGTQSSQFAISTNDSGYNGTGNGEYTIQVAAGGLPDITDTVVLDGTTQAGFVDKPIIELDGSGAGVDADGFHISAGGSGSRLKGLVINRFTGNYGSGIEIASASGVGINGNYIGTDVSGTVALGVAAYGAIHLNNADGNTISENVISGNGSSGIWILNSDNNTVQGNLIGTDSSGTLDLGNQGSGIYINSGSSGNLIGGADPGDGNVIAFSNWEGITSFRFRSR